MIGKLPGTNPVIAAVEAGHVHAFSDGDGLHCAADKTPWPCADILVARVESALRFHQAQQAQAVEAGRLSYQGRT